MLSNKKSTICPRTLAQYLACIGKPSIAKLFHNDKHPIITFIEGLKYE